MLDLKAMRDERRTPQERRAVKTFLTDTAIKRLQFAADYTGAHLYEIIEKLILEQLPEPSQLDGKK